MTDELEKRELPFSGTLNEEDRTVEVCWSTGARVKRYSYEEGYYLEELQVDAKSVRMDRFNAMSLLDSHDNYSMDSRLGTVVPGSVRFAGGKAYARIKFSKKQRAEEIFQDVRDGHKLAISVGYKTHRYEKTEGADGQMPVLRATDWEPMELSAVPIPADAGAFSRSEKEPQTMTTAEQSRAVATAERRRIREIEGLATTAKFRVDDELVRKAVDEETTVEQFRSQLVDAMIAKQNQAPTFPIVETRGMGYDRNGMTRSDAIADALQYRMDPRHKPKDGSREFVNLSLMELARSSLEASGVSTRGMGLSEVAIRALHTTSDFPIALAGLAQASLRSGYEGVSSGLKSVARRTAMQNFLPKRSIQLSEFPSLKKVNEHGEFTRGTVYESEESYQLETHGRIIGFTRQMIINDQLGAFSKVSEAFGKKSSQREAELLVELLLANPKMKSDGNPLFHASHKNLGTPAALSVEALSVARTNFRKQVDMTGDVIGAKPKYLIVGPDLQTQAEKILAEIHPNRANDVNVFSGQLELIVEDRLVKSETEWYLAADPYNIEGLEYAYLAGEEGPQFDEQPGFNIDGVEYKVRLDFGAGFLDWRGWYRNAGV